MNDYSRTHGFDSAALTTSVPPTDLTDQIELADTSRAASVRSVSTGYDDDHGLREDRLAWTVALTLMVLVIGGVTGVGFVVGQPVIGLFAALLTLGLVALSVALL